VDVLLPIVGALLVLLLLGDLMVTILHPSRRGFISWRAQREVWRSTRAVARGIDSEALLSYAAPLSMVAGAFLAWFAGLWLGFALIYLPFVDDGLSYASDAHFASHGFLEAVYLSGTALTTIGFGDVAAGTDVLRLVTVLEGASGLAAVTGAITYVLSVYPLISEVRREAQRLADDGAENAAGAAGLVVHGGPGELRTLQNVLLEVHGQIRRFPVLFYFHAQRDEETLWHLLHGAALVTLQVRWGVAHEDELEDAAWHGAALERSLARVMRDLERDFLRGEREEHLLTDEQIAGALENLRGAAESAAPGRAAEGDAKGFAEFLSHAEAFLELLAGTQGYEHVPLL
jgi:Ion channel